jgi:hypothetical protein
VCVIIHYVIHRVQVTEVGSFGGHRDDFFFFSPPSQLRISFRSKYIMRFCEKRFYFN